MDHRMKGDHLPGNDHVVRYCPGSKIAEDGTPLATASTIRALHEPSKYDPAPAGIHDTAQDEMIIAELIAETVVTLYAFP
jgi:hypothetical protein